MTSTARQACAGAGRHAHGRMDAWTHAPPCRHTRMHARSHAHTHARMHALTHARMHARTHTSTCTHSNGADVCAQDVQERWGGGEGVPLAGERLPLPHDRGALGWMLCCLLPACVRRGCSTRAPRYASALTHPLAPTNEPLNCKLPVRRALPYN